MEILIPIVLLLIGVGLNIINKVAERKRAQEERQRRAQARPQGAYGSDVRTAQPRRQASEGASWQQQTAKPRPAAEPARQRPGRPVSAVATWQCENCGVVLRKGGLGEAIEPGDDINRLDLKGVNTCALCGSRYPQAEVYAGAYDAHPQRATVSREQLERRVMALRGRSDEVARRYLADAEAQLAKRREQQAPAQRPQQKAPAPQQKRDRPQKAPQQTKRAQPQRQASAGKIRKTETISKAQRSHARREADAMLGRAGGQSSREAARDKGMSRLGREAGRVRNLMEQDAATQARRKPQHAYLAPRHPTPGAEIPVAKWLQDPAELRKGIILREVLGPPKGLQRS